MSLTLDMIEIKEMPTDNSGHAIVRARMQLTNDMKMPMVERNDAAIYARAKHSLKMSLISFVYGDLIEPINKLALLADYHVTSNADSKEIKELRAQIGFILIGTKL